MDEQSTGVADIAVEFNFCVHLDPVFGEERGAIE